MAQYQHQNRVQPPVVVLPTDVASARVVLQLVTAIVDVALHPNRVRRAVPVTA